ncbi:uncharacterized protein BJ171DRAFT_635586, partial [Polychytrium aggregatum]|uniref:uncharacterized protein n=1 Tax=Polychytrium aggregatum TaxID=110093 RepID=UPI0022FF186F
IFLPPLGHGASLLSRNIKSKGDIIKSTYLLLCPAHRLLRGFVPKHVAIDGPVLHGPLLSVAPADSPLVPCMLIADVAPALPGLAIRRRRHHAPCMVLGVLVMLSIVAAVSLLSRHRGQICHGPLPYRPAVALGTNTDGGGLGAHKSRRVAAVGHEPHPAPTASISSAPASTSTRCLCLCFPSQEPKPSPLPNPKP